MFPRWLLRTILVMLPLCFTWIAVSRAPRAAMDPAIMASVDLCFTVVLFLLGVIVFIHDRFERRHLYLTFLLMLTPCCFLLGVMTERHDGLVIWWGVLTLIYGVVFAILARERQ